MPNESAYKPESQSGFSTGLFLGLVLGSVGGYYLSTKEGRQLLNRVVEASGDKLELIKNSRELQNLLTELGLNKPKEVVVNSPPNKEKTKKKRLFQGVSLRPK